MGFVEISALTRGRGYEQDVSGRAPGPGIGRLQPHAWANNAILPLALDGSGFKVLNGSGGTVHFILDVNGYFQ